MACPCVQHYKLNVHPSQALRSLPSRHLLRVPCGAHQPLLCALVLTGALLLPTWRSCDAPLGYTLHTRSCGLQSAGTVARSSLSKGDAGVIADPVHPKLQSHDLTVSGLLRRARMSSRLQLQAMMASLL